MRGVRPKFSFWMIVAIVFLVFIPLVFSVSFSSGPVLNPSANITTVNSFTCDFTPSGVGSLRANITWFKNNGSWTVFDKDTNYVVTDGVLTSAPTAIVAANTTKDQEWLCEVRLSNGTTVLATNSSSLIIQNSKPDVFYPTEEDHFDIFEEIPFNLTAIGSDPDLGDPSFWSFVDITTGLDSFCSIDTSGFLSCYVNDSTSITGNHTVIVRLSDGGSDSGVYFLLEVHPSNDAPVFTTSSLNLSCVEGTLCTHQLVATDEENSPLSFAQINFTSEVLLNMGLNGSISLMPNYTHAVHGQYTINVSVSDGNKTTYADLTLLVNATNHEPIIDYQNVSGMQGSYFFFEINATDYLDSGDEVNFTITSNCQGYSSITNPWSFNESFIGNTTSPAYAYINVTLTNDHIVCRSVSIAVDDYSSSGFKNLPTETINLTFNISNTNDAPLINNQSYSGNNVGHYSINNLTGSTGFQFSYQLNVTDIDVLTYEGEVINYSTNSSNFSISSSGLLTSNGILSNDGNYSFSITAFDDGGLNNTRIVTVFIVANNPPLIFLNNSANCLEDTFCYKHILANDSDGTSSVTLQTVLLKIISPLNSTVFYNDSASRSLLGVVYKSFNSPITEYVFNFTPEDSVIGNASLNITFVDAYGASNSSLFSFDFIPVNDNPQLDNDSLFNITENITFDESIVEGFSFNKTIYAFDNDSVYLAQNLTFNFSFINGSLPVSRFNLTQVNNSQAVFQINPELGDSGNYTINISVADNYNGLSFQILTFHIYNSTESPLITAIRPHYNSSDGLITSFQSILSSNTSTAISVFENTSVLFDVAAQDFDNLSLNLAWYINNELISSDNYSGAGSFPYEYNFSFFENSSVNVTAQVSDIGYDMFTWFVSVINVNRPPEFMHSINNLSNVAGTQTFVNFFRQSSTSEIVFLDPDDDLNNNNIIDETESNSLNFSINSSSSCNDYAAFSFSGDDMTITPKTVGICYAQFIATDAFNETVSSNNVEIVITRLDERSDRGPSSGTQTVTQTITVPYEQEVDVPKELNLIVPGVTSVYKNNTVLIPIQIINTWEKSISGIVLSANASLDNITFSFSKDSITSLNKGADINLNLTVFPYRLDAPFEVNIVAYVTSLDFTDIETVHIDALEKGKTSPEELLAKISFARDLLRDNPECQELNELLDNAKQSVGVDDGQDVLDVINSIVTGCKYLMGEDKPSQSTLPRSFIGRLGVYTNALLDVRLLLTILSILFVFAILVGVVHKFTSKKI